MFRIYTYKMASAGAKALAQALNCKRIREEGRDFRRPAITINWGNSKQPLRYLGVGRFLNDPYAIQVASNKLTAFEQMTAGGVVTVPYTQSPDRASAWLLEGKKVVCRHLLRSSSGKGITIVEEGQDLPDAPLYTRYMPKANEWRVHVVNGEAIHVQRKARKADVPDEEVNWQIRNLAGGFIFSHLNLQVPEGLLELGISAVSALNLTFGAVDILETPRGKLMVLEVNTAPGLEGTTLEKYCEAFIKLRDQTGSD